MIDFLNKGVWEKYNREYHTALGYSMTISIPNNAFAGMNYFNETIDNYMKAGWFKRIFLTDPYKVFNYILQRSIMA